MNFALFALTAGAFGIGVTEFVIMGLLLDVSKDLGVSISMAGLLISGYALGVVVGAPLLTALTTRWPRKNVLIGLMVVFTLGNLACAIAPSYGFLMAARILTALSHGTFFGVGSIVATSLVSPDKKASAIAIMFTGLTVANIIGVPFGTWLGQSFGWRSTFWAVTVIGIIAVSVLSVFVPKGKVDPEAANWKADLKAMAQRPVLLGLLTTVLGFGGVFAVFTYIAPMLTQITGFGEAAVSPILLLFGIGMVIGNLVSGKLADKNLLVAVLGSLLLLALTLALMTFAIHGKASSILFALILGATAFATTAPLQMWVMDKAVGAGQGLASSFNIAAFNLGNALGAWLGGYVIAHGPGLGAIPWVSALLPLGAVAIVLFSRKLDQRAIQEKAI